MAQPRAPRDPRKSRAIARRAAARIPDGSSPLARGRTSQLARVRTRADAATSRAWCAPAR